MRAGVIGLDDVERCSGCGCIVGHFYDLAIRPFDATSDKRVADQVLWLRLTWGHYCSTSNSGPNCQ